MSLVTIIQEIWRFIKENARRFLIGGLIGAVLIVGLRYGMSEYVLRDGREAYQELHHVYSQEPASFQILVTVEDGQLFNNAFAYEEYLASEEVVQKIEAETGLQFGSWLSNEKTLQLEKTTDFRGGLAGLRNPDSNVFTFRFAVGQSPEENLKIAQAYANYLMTEPHEDNFMANHTIEMVREPMIGEMIPEELLANVGTPDSLSIYGVLTPFKTVIYAVLGFIIGFLVCLLVEIIRSLTHRKIKYGFDYTWDYEDQHLLFKLDNNASQTDLQDVLQVGQTGDRLILSQVNPAEEADLHMGEGIFFKDHVGSLPKDTHIKDVVILIFSHQTDKNWYKEQFNLVKLYRLPIKIIHVY